ncbi:MAG: hypothetical protein LBT01_05645 [Spirochaetaceae bacterium]|jgi:hypothetical protein|nr:hypothetical protein [Spirochaetaceae bacterium]
MSFLEEKIGEKKLEKKDWKEIIGGEKMKKGDGRRIGCKRVLVVSAICFYAALFFVPVSGLVIQMLWVVMVFLGLCLYLAFTIIRKQMVGRTTFSASYGAQAHLKVNLQYGEGFLRYGHARARAPAIRGGNLVQRHKR